MNESCNDAAIPAAPTNKQTLLESLQMLEDRISVRDTRTETKTLPLVFVLFCPTRTERSDQNGRGPGQLVCLSLLHPPGRQTEVHLIRETGNTESGSAVPTSALLKSHKHRARLASALSLAHITQRTMNNGTDTQTELASETRNLFH